MASILCYSVCLGFQVIAEMVGYGKAPRNAGQRADRLIF